jgi:sugar lactone lactonase YvrE
MGMSAVEIFDDRACVLGEGPLWHPLRGQFFWFDILRKCLMSRIGEQTLEWQFDEHVSAAGWVDENRLLIASETSLSTFDLNTGDSEWVIGLEVDNTVTRSNDGRADPFGGFWIGTMGKSAEKGAGSIYRFYKGELRKLYGDISVSNAICFAPDGACAYFTDTHSNQVMRQPLGPDGWPDGAPEVFIDLREQGLNPDGAVVDSTGFIWLALWGAGQIARYDPQGQFLSAIDYPASQMTCPSFGGPDLTRLYATSAAVHLDEAQGGQTFVIQTDVTGQREHQVIL